MAKYNSSDHSYEFDGLNVQYGLGLAFNMAGKYPAITKRIFDTKAMAQAFVDDKNDSAVVGLTLTVISDGDNNGVYFVKSIGDGTNAGVLEKLGSSQGTSDVMSAVTALQQAVGASGKTEFKEALTGTTAGDAETVAAAVNALDAALKAVQDIYLSGATVNNVTGTVTNHVVSVTISADDITADTAVGSKDDTAKISEALAELDRMIDAVSGSASDTSAITSVYGAKAYTDDKVAEAVKDLAVSATGDTYVDAHVDSTNNKKVVVSATTALTSAVSNANSALQSVSATGDSSLLTATFASKDGNNAQALTVSSTTKLQNAVASAETALQTVSASGAGFVSASAATKSSNTQAINVALTTKDVSAATTADNGLAVAADVKTYVDNKTNASKTVVSKVDGSYSGLTISADTTATDGHVDYKVTLTDVASAAALAALKKKLDDSKTLSSATDGSYEVTAQIKYVAGTTDTPAHIAIVNEDNTELSSIEVSDIVGNGVLDHSSYNSTTGILTLAFKNASGGTTDYTVDLKSMLDINDVLVSGDSQNYLKATQDTSASGDQEVILSILTQNISAATSSTKTGLADAADVKTYVDSAVSGKNVSAEGEIGDAALVAASADNNKVTVSSTTKLQNAVASAETALQTVSASGDSYVSASFATKSSNAQALTVTTHTQDVSGATAAVDGLAVAYETKQYIDKQVSDKNVSASGETGTSALVTASAANNAVTVSSTTRLQSAVTRAMGAVLSVTEDGSTENFVSLTVTGSDDVKIAISDATLKTEIDTIKSNINQNKLTAGTINGVAATLTSTTAGTSFSATVGASNVSGVTAGNIVAAGTVASAITSLDNAISGLTNLTTDAKTSVVAAINEVDAHADAAASAATKATVTAATFNSVTGTVSTGAAGTSIAFTVDGDDLKIGDYTATSYAESFSSKTGVSTVASGDTLDQAINKVEGSLKVLVDEVIANEQTAASGISALATTIGITSGAEIKYTANSADKYISGATSLTDADDKLDAAIKELSETVTKNAVVGENAIVVSAETNDTKVSLKLHADSDNTTVTGIKLTQSTDGLKAELSLDNAAATSGSGVGLAVQSDGTVKATMYWGTF